MTNLPDFTVSFLKSYLKKNTIEKIHLLLGRIWIQSTNYVLLLQKGLDPTESAARGLAALSACIYGWLQACLLFCRLSYRYL